MLQPSLTVTITATAGDYDVFTWDPVGRLIRVVQHDASDNVQQTIEYGYDANGLMSGRRTLDSSGAVITETGYLHDGLQRIMELDLSGTEQAITKLYLHGTQPNEIVATDIYDGTDYDSVWAFTDILGSVTTVASEASGSWKIVHNVSREYGSGREQFGDTTETALTSTAIWAGHHLDEATGLLEAKARWYDPGSGRFIGQDLIGFKAGDENLYRYVGNGPTDATDPNGLKDPAVGELDFSNLAPPPEGGVDLGPEFRRVTPVEDVVPFYLKPIQWAYSFSHWRQDNLARRGKRNRNVELNGS